MRGVTHLARFGVVPACLLLGACLEPLDYRVGAGPAGQRLVASAPVSEPAIRLPLPAPGPQYALDDLLALTAQGLRALLGEPGLLRREGNGQMWRYAGGECVLFLFLYPVNANGSGPAQVTHAEIGARQAGLDPDRAGCIDALVKGRGQG